MTAGRRVAIVFAVVLVAACSSSSATPDTPSSSTAAARDTTTSSAPATTTTTTTTGPAFTCSATPGNTSATLHSGGLDRTYFLEVPRSLTAPAPVILNLHGYGSYATEQASYSRLPNEGGDRGFIVVTPAGQGSPQHWNLLPAAGEATDYEFLGALLDSLEATGCVDADREYATGISNGGAMSAFLACAFNDRLAAVATVAFTLKPVGCEAGQTMPMLAFHGTADPLVPYTGGTVLGLSFAGAETGIADWATQDGCSSTPTETAIADDVTRLDFPRCPDGLAVQLYRIEGGGHTWPGSPVNVSRLGATTHSIDASQLMLDFFSQHARSDR